MSEKLIYQSTIAETQYGRVSGAIVDGVHLFCGIPYGGPTEGAGRWMPPTKPAGWPGVRDATRNGPSSPQPRGGGGAASPDMERYFHGGRQFDPRFTSQIDGENCLMLNILTNGLSGKRPVVVYIHGGGFSSGSGIYINEWDQFVREQDVVLVGVTHRLNIFGYLYLGGLSDKYKVGNVGQLDLIAALEWIRDNIAYFGGDSSCVTVLGESGGGAKIGTLLGMPAARGLFRRAIVLSGSFLHCNTAEESTSFTRSIMATLGLSDNQVEALMDLTTEQLVASMAPKPGIPSAFLRYSPVVDGITLPGQPWEPTASACAQGIPIIIGCTKDEAAGMLATPQLYDLDWSGLRVELGKLGLAHGDVDALTDIYRRNHPTESASDLYFRIRTDCTMRPRVVRQAELKVKQGDPVFIYSFNWNTPVENGRLRAFHTADLHLGMHPVGYPASEPLARQIAGAWASFARSGNPNCALLPQWPAYTLAERPTMIYDVTSSCLVNDPDGKAREFLLGKQLQAVL